jgi:hypothetical protein
MARGYADLVGIAEDCWQQGQRTLEAGLRDLERHVPGGGEPAVEVAVVGSRAVEAVAVAESTVELAVAVDPQAPAALKPRRSRRAAE